LVFLLVGSYVFQVSNMASVASTFSGLRAFHSLRWGAQKCTFATLAQDATNKRPRRILLCNDDGPPGENSRYIETFYRALRARDYEVHVCLPAQQRSMTGKSLQPWQTVSIRKQAYDGDTWWLCDGATPAAAANIGLHHGPGPFDLVLSGPNFGRNDGAHWALSSGTVAAALEASMSGVKSVAVSFDNGFKETSLGDAGAGSSEQVTAASEVAVDLVERLYEQWPTDVDLFNVNVPLSAVESGSSAPIAQACMERRLRYGSIFQQSTKGDYRFSYDLFDWQTQFPKSEGALPTDTEALKSGRVSVTPLRASLGEVDCDLSSLLAGSGSGQQQTSSSSWVYPFAAGAGTVAMATMAAKQTTACE
jgi:5'/3'-nucleotidase SurE